MGSEMASEEDLASRRQFGSMNTGGCEFSSGDTQHFGKDSFGWQGDGRATGTSRNAEWELVP